MLLSSAVLLFYISMKAWSSNVCQAQRSYNLRHFKLHSAKNRLLSWFEVHPRIPSPVLFSQRHGATPATSGRHVELFRASLAGLPAARAVQLQDGVRWGRGRGSVSLHHPTLRSGSHLHRRLLLHLRRSGPQNILAGR